MTLQDVQKLILSLQDKFIKAKIFSQIKYHYEDAYQFIENYYDWPEDTLSSTKLYWIMNGLKEIPKCIVCGKQLDINQISSRTRKYRLHCSHYCGCHSQHARDAFKATCMEKYGIEHNMKSKIGIEEYSKSIKDKYGTDYIFQNEEIKNKIKKTCIEKYGVDVISKAEIVKQKISASNLNKTASEKEAIAAKSKQTKLERYNDANYVNVEKAHRTLIEKYGVDSIFKLQKTKDAASIACKTKSYNEIICKDIHDRPCFSLQQYLERNSDNEYFEFECLKCHKKFLSRHHDGYHDHCQDCYPKEEGHEEKIFGNFIRELDNNVIENTRLIIKPLELDIYCPNRKLAFEFDGLYWHSQDVCKESLNYHLHKTEECEKQGIQLIHIFENEWLYKTDIVKSRIKNLFGKYDKTVFARKCIVKDLDNKTSREFQEINHIQGAVNSKVDLGLFYNDELVSLMTFSKCRFDKKHEWELLRFCNKLGYHVPGAAGKLLKHFEKNYNPKSLVSYADRRWSRGKVYNVLGFKLNHISPPNYWYWKTNNFLESRIKFQKHKLCNILENYSDNKSEHQNMLDNGYHIIYDCGNLVFEKIYDKGQCCVIA